MVKRDRDRHCCLENALEYIRKETDVNSVELMIASYKEDMIISLAGKLINHNPSFINRVQKLKLSRLHCIKFFPTSRPSTQPQSCQFCLICLNIVLHDSCRKQYIRTAAVTATRGLQV